MLHRLKSPWAYPTAFSLWGQEEVNAIERVLTSGRLTMGAEVEAFEQEFADWHGMKHGIMVNSGSSANLIAVASLFEHGLIVEGDLVAVPALAWATTYAPLVQRGLKLKLIDCDWTWNADIGLLHGCDVDLVVGCSILGNPAYLDEMDEYADSSGAIMIEDNCESFGAVLPSGKRCGTLGLLNTFSFFYSHQISAVEGGMILTNDADLADLCRMLRAHGWSRDVEPPVAFDDEYDFRVFGYNVRPVEMHAAIGREQLKRMADHQYDRSRNAQLFRELTVGLPIQHPILHAREPNSIYNTSPFGLAFTVRGPAIRNTLVSAFRDAGIDCRLPTGGSFTRHKYGKPWANQYTPNADRIHTCGLFLGNAPFDISDLIIRAVNVMQQVQL